MILRVVDGSQLMSVSTQQRARSAFGVVRSAFGGRVFSFGVLYKITFC